MDFRITHKLSQSLTLTPKLQQAIKLLQLGRQDLLELVENELVENPLLEDTKSHDYAQVSTSDWQVKKSRGDDSNHNMIEQAVANKASLQDYLMEQLRLSELNEHQEQIAAQIIGNLDQQGYLCCSTEEIAQECNASLEEVQAVLSIIQSFDPIGIGAKDLSECLLIQLDHIGLANDLSAKIITNHLEQVAKNDLRQIADSEKVSVEQVKQAIEVIRKLEPYPGKMFVDEAVDYIVPDVLIYKRNDEYVVSLNEEGFPKLQLNPQYLQMLAKDMVPASEKSYFTQRYQSANWLIRSLEQRQKTILDVTHSIIKFQKEFLDAGPAKLKPLVLKDIADDLGIHESTVSRVTSNKYAYTTQGLIPMKFFFSNAIATEDGEISAVSVKDRIKALITGETPNKPLSDQELVKILAKENITVARRTVAKYRESLGIPATSIRRRKTSV